MCSKNVYNRAMGRQGKCLSGTARSTYNVSEFTALEKTAGRCILRMNVVDHVAKACRLSVSTVPTSDEKKRLFNTRYTTDRKQIKVDDFKK